MNGSILSGKSILVVDDKPDHLAVMEHNIREAAPECRLDTATTYERARDLLASWSYDITVVGMTGSRACKLLRRAVFSKVPAVVLSVNGRDSEALLHELDPGVSVHLPRSRVHQIVPFLEGVLQRRCMAGWRWIWDRLGFSLKPRRGVRPFLLSSNASQR